MQKARPTRASGPSPEPATSDGHRAGGRAVALVRFQVRVVASPPGGKRRQYPGRGTRTGRREGGGAVRSQFANSHQRRNMRHVQPKSTAKSGRRRKTGARGGLAHRPGPASGRRGGLAGPPSRRRDGGPALPSGGPSGGVLPQGHRQRRRAPLSAAARTGTGGGESGRCLQPRSNAIAMERHVTRPGQGGEANPADGLNPFSPTVCHCAGNMHPCHGPSVTRKMRLDRRTGGWTGRCAGGVAGQAARQRSLPLIGPR